MGRLIKLHEIEEFSEVKTIPDATISEKILAEIRNLDEKNEIERFIREIIYDPNETPHGPTEIVDILTSHVQVRGDKRITAFIIKGKSFKRVSSRDVTHQFAKMRQIPGLGLLVFGAVGNIQDDAQRDFLQTAVDTDCDHLIIDAQDFSRLFIAYEKICPKDGIPYDNTGTCTNGHVRDEGLALEIEVREKISYTILKQRDVSHAGAKRYSAFILLDKHYSKDVIRKIIQEATEKLKYSNYYRNEQVKARWGKIPAHVVWLFIAYDLDDIQHTNWVCSTYWVDKLLSEDMRPTSLGGNDKIGNIEVLWNDNYKSHKEFLKSISGTKEEVLEAIYPILNEMVELARKTINYFEEYKRGNIFEDKFIMEMQKMEPIINDLYRQSVNIPIAPQDCKDFYLVCKHMFDTVGYMFFYYSKKGLEKWSKNTRDRFMQDTIKRFYDDLKKINFEESKIH